jgi:hypothetical protein
MYDCSKGTEFIESIETWNSGGNVMLDIIKLKSGKILVLSDEVVCKYNSIGEFMGDEGEYHYERHCAELIDYDLPEHQPTPNSSLIGRPFEYNGVTITNPFLSECGRFSVKPEFYYGGAYLNSLKGER